MEYSNMPTSRQNNMTIDTILNNTFQNDVHMHERIAVILRQQNINMTVEEYLSSISSLTDSAASVTTTLPVNIRYVSEGISWGVVAPLILIGLFLVAIASCLYWQSWKEKRRMRHFLAQQRPPDMMPYERSGETRMSMRSIESQRSRGSSTCERVPVVPFRRQNSKFFLRAEEETRNVATLARKLSPIDERPHHRSVDTMVSAAEREDDGEKPLVTAVQVTWGTPKTSGTDSRLDVLKGYENPCFSAPGKLVGNVYCDECNAMSSPYFPNNNTPTTDYDVDSEKSGNVAAGMEHPDGVYPTKAYHTIQPLPTSFDGAEISSITVPESSHAQVLNNGQSSSGSAASSGTLSLPSSISRFHASRHNNTPNYPFASTRNCSPMRLNFTVSSSIEISDHYSDNTSMYPCVGSSSTSIGTQAASRTNTLHSLNSDDLRTYHLDPRSRSVSAPETRRSSVEIVPGFKAYSVEVDLFRTINVSAQTSSGTRSCVSASVSCSVAGGVPHHPTPVSTDGAQWDTHSSVGTDKQVLDENQNVHGYDLSALPGRKVKFSVPVLDKKQYWV